eukprot:scaffold3769_cov51-Isochrysis_galbana.AAC.1
MLLASLFRNFLLAQRILSRFNVHPVSLPAIPPTHTHPLWDAWDLAVETVLVQLAAATKDAPDPAAAASPAAPAAASGIGMARGG